MCNVTSGCCLSHQASVFRISLRDLCRSLHARLTSATKFMYIENGYDKSSNRGAPLRTVALHAMYETVHRALINRYTYLLHFVRSRKIFVSTYDIVRIRLGLHYVSTDTIGPNHRVRTLVVLQLALLPIHFVRNTKRKEPMFWYHVGIIGHPQWRLAGQRLRHLSLNYLR